MFVAVTIGLQSAVNNIIKAGFCLLIRNVNRREICSNSNKREWRFFANKLCVHWK